MITREEEGGAYKGKNTKKEQGLETLYLSVKHHVTSLFVGTVGVS